MSEDDNQITISSRTGVVSASFTLADLLKKSVVVSMPKNMFADPEGNLKSAIVDKVEVSQQHSTVPVTLAVRFCNKDGKAIGGLPGSVTSTAGDVVNMIVMPNQQKPPKNAKISGQQTETFHKKFSETFEGYTKSNIDTKGIYDYPPQDGVEVKQVSLSHPSLFFLMRDDEVQAKVLAHIDQHVTGVAPNHTLLAVDVLKEVNSRIKDDLKDAEDVQLDELHLSISADSAADIDDYLDQFDGKAKEQQALYNEEMNTKRKYLVTLDFSLLNAAK